VIAVAAAGCGADAQVTPDAAIEADAPTPDAAPPRPPAVIILIGDGMGMEQLGVASQFRHGETGRLAMEALPARGEVRTGGPSGTTDSAAAATVMATGVYTYNGNIGVDRDEQPVASLVERAHARGWAAGIVTTTSIPHATPAAFSAHVDSRGELLAIADQQALVTRPEVMLGGGAQYFKAAGSGSLRSDDGLLDELAAAGYTIVTKSSDLAAAVATRATTRLFGAFATDQMTYVADRTPTSVEPMLAEQALAALEVLDRDPDGFFLMIEGGRIDHGGHENNLVNVVQETLAFDDAIAEVVAWARARGNTTVLVTADHECGGLHVPTPAAAGVYPAVTWRWGNHTNARVAVFGDGPGTEVVDGAVIDQRWIHAIAQARIDDVELIAPPREAIPDGELGDLRHRAALQAASTGFGAGLNQLDALWLDAAPRGLSLGVEGLFEWGTNAVELWIDVDLGAGTGPSGLAGALSDGSGTIDAILGESTVSAPAMPGFGADFAVVSFGGSDPRLEDLVPEGGLRGLRAPFGDASDLGWYPSVINFGGDVRTSTTPRAPIAGQGLEVFVPWSTLYPGGVPAGAKVAVAAVMVNTDGGYTSNQALPAFATSTANPGRTVTPLPGVVVYELDHDGDGTIDGDEPPTVRP